MVSDVKVSFGTQEAPKGLGLGSTVTSCHALMFRVLCCRKPRNAEPDLNEYFEGLKLPNLHITNPEEAQHFVMLRTRNVCCWSL